MGVGQPRTLALENYQCVLRAPLFVDAWTAALWLLLMLEPPLPEKVAFAKQGGPGMVMLRACETATGSPDLIPLGDWLCDQGRPVGELVQAWRDKSKCGLRLRQQLSSKLEELVRAALRNATTSNCVK